MSGPQTTKPAVAPDGEPEGTGAPVYLCHNPFTDPAFNLALEEVLLTGTDRDMLLLWRNARSVIIGRNQNAHAEVDLAYARENGIPVVRRLSGGGAVFHDLGNINFSFIHALRPGDFSNYERFTRPVCDFLRTLGLAAVCAGRNDLLLGGKKISGNAQAVKNGRILHHGTILYSANVGDLAKVLRPDAAKVAGKGVRSVRSRVTNLAEHLADPLPPEGFLAALYAYFLRTQSGVQETTLSDDDMAAAKHLAAQKHETWEWNFGRAPAYTHAKSARFPFGKVEVCLSVAGGTIRQADIFGDFFGRRDKSELEAALVGCPHQPAAIATALREVAVEEIISGMRQEELLALF